MLNDSAPVFNLDLNRGFRTWNIAEIYQGQLDTNGYNNHVPNVNDAVIDWDVGLLRVTFVNLETGIPTLEPWRIPTRSGVSELDAILGLQGAPNSGGFRAYVNNDVNPRPISIDSQLQVYGTSASHAKIFLGVDISEETGDVISVRYNESGDVISDNIPLESVTVGEDITNAIKTVRTGFVTQQINNGELLTVVIYNDNNTISSTARLLAVDTSFVKPSAGATKHITDIRVLSPFVSTVAERTINYPHNLPLNSAGLMGQVVYSDGSVKRVLLSGTRMALLGMKGYVPSVVGQRVPLVLTYRLEEDEASFSQYLSNGAISIPYSLVTTDIDTIYNIKLFVVPQWKGTVEGYKLRYYAYNADRNLSVEVTDKVELDVTRSMVYQPTQYGVEQRIAVVFDLVNLGVGYRSVRHLQTFAISLLGTPTTVDAPYLIDYNADGERVYGEGVNAIACQSLSDPSKYEIDVSAGKLDVNEYLRDLFTPSDPLVLRATEAQAPNPTHIRIKVDGVVTYRPISEFRERVIIDFVPNTSCVVTIEWVKETPTSNLLLGISPLSLVIE